MASPSMIVGAAAVVAAVKSSRWFMGRATTSEALEGLARSKRHTGRITQAAKQIVLLHLGIFAVLPPSGRSCSHSPRELAQHGLLNLIRYTRALQEDVGV